LYDTTYNERGKLKSEFFEALHRVKKEGRFSKKHQSDNIRPVTVPLNSDGETLLISCNNVSKFLNGNASLSISYIVPNGFIDMENEHPHSYAKEVYESEALDMVHSVIDDVFDVNSINFSFSDVTSKTFIFKNVIYLQDPTIVPMDEEYEITPVLTVNIEKKYIYKQKSKSTVHHADYDNVDMVIKPNLEEKNVEFDEDVNLFGNNLTVKHRNEENLGSVIALEKDGEVYGYVSNLGGDWNHLIDAKGEYPDGDLF